METVVDMWHVTTEKQSEILYNLLLHFSFPVTTKPGSSLFLASGCCKIDHYLLVKIRLSPPLFYLNQFEWVSVFYSQRNPVLDGYQKEKEHSINHQTKIKAPMEDYNIRAKLALIYNALI